LGFPIKSPVSGLLLENKVKLNDQVDKGDVIFLVNAMKMEHSVRSPCKGKVTSILVSPGSPVQTEQILATVGMLLSFLVTKILKTKNEKHQSPRQLSPGSRANEKNSRSPKKYPRGKEKTQSFDFNFFNFSIVRVILFIYSYLAAEKRSRRYLERGN